MLPQTITPKTMKLKTLLLFLMLSVIQLSCKNEGNQKLVKQPKKTSRKVNQISPTSTASFTFNQAISNYRFDRQQGKTYHYVDTQIPTEIIDSPNSMVFTEMQDMNLDARTGLFWFWIDTMVKGKDFKKKDLEQLKIGKYDALVFDSDYEKDKIKGAVYMVLLADGDRVVKFQGSAYWDIENARRQFKKTVESITLK